MENIQQPTPVTKVGQPSLVVIVVSLGWSDPGKVIAAVVIELMESDDDVPDPGSAKVGPDQDGAEGHGHHAVEHEV